MRILSPLNALPILKELDVGMHNDGSVLEDVQQKVDQLGKLIKLGSRHNPGRVAFRNAKTSSVTF